jgi:NAD(P)-dependent dehydrogenase (short-subunit alcohol dehydrogenase family)
MEKLHQRVAVITGGSRGLGRAIALELAKDAVRLALVGRDEGKLKETAAQAVHNGHRYPDRWWLDSAMKEGSLLDQRRGANHANNPLLVRRGGRDIKKIRRSHL